MSTNIVVICSSVTPRAFSAGIGVAILPAAEPTPRPGTVEIPLRPKATRQIGLIWTADRALAPAALAFRDFVSSRA